MTWKPILQIELSQPFRDVVRGYGKPRRREIARVIDALAASFGSAHVHSGLGIRRLRGNYFECRSGLELRLVFRAERGVIHLLTVGTHDQVHNFIKSL